MRLGIFVSNQYYQEIVFLLIAKVQAFINSVIQPKPTHYLEYGFDWLENHFKEMTLDWINTFLRNRT